MACKRIVTTKIISSGSIQEADVRLRDILMKNGPCGRPSRSGSDGEMSRIMISILGLLAYNVFKGSRGQAAPLLRATPHPGPPPPRWL